MFKVISLFHSLINSLHFQTPSNKFLTESPKFVRNTTGGSGKTIVFEGGVLKLSLYYYFLAFVLKCSNIMRVFHGEFPSSEAKKLGTFLDISNTKLQEFKKNNLGDVEGMMLDVLNYWLETDPRKSWAKLAEAVEDCGYGVLAKKIQLNNTENV